MGEPLPLHFSSMLRTCAGERNESSLNVERSGAVEGAGSCVVYNPSRSLSVTQQRQRLPIFKVSVGRSAPAGHGRDLPCLVLAAAPQSHSVPGGATPLSGGGRGDWVWKDHADPSGVSLWPVGGVSGRVHSLYSPDLPCSIF